MGPARSGKLDRAFSMSDRNISDIIDDPFHPLGSMLDIWELASNHGDGEVWDELEEILIEDQVQRYLTSLYAPGKVPPGRSIN